jgi:hypothetical protein
MKDVRCLPVPREHLATIWPIVSPMLARAVDTSPGKLSVDDIIAGAYQGSYVIWVIVVDEEIIASVTTRIIDYPKCRAMALDWVGGKRMREWFGPAMRVIKEHAVRNQCSHMEGYGREAWLRWIEPEGWRREYTAFRMELSDVDHTVSPV